MREVFERWSENTSEDYNIWLKENEVELSGSANDTVQDMIDNNLVSFSVWVDKYLKENPITEEEAKVFDDFLKRDTGMVNKILSMSMGEQDDDTLAIAICTYFNNSPNRPKEDRVDPTNWSPWVLEQYENVRKNLIMLVNNLK